MAIVVLLVLLVFAEGAYRAWDEVRPRRGRPYRKPEEWVQQRLFVRIAEAGLLIKRLEGPLSDYGFEAVREDAADWIASVERILGRAVTAWYGRFAQNPTPQRVEESMDAPFMRSWLQGKVKTLEGMCEVHDTI